MGNSIGGRRKAKVMKIDGEMFKLKTPVTVGQVLKDYPGFVLLESEAVRHMGVRAKPLVAEKELKPRRLYFLVELPKAPDQRQPRKVRSGINMNAKDRLESLMLSRRSVSDLTHVARVVDSEEGGEGAVRVRLRLPKAQVAKLMEESKDATDAAEKIMELCAAKEEEEASVVGKNKGSMVLQQGQWRPALGSIEETLKQGREMRTGLR
eukprot:TRINITY_DN19875_c0_g1_i1.p1 TRINITY_DN19875_c0_g1~~TRINITY_DN19875_c0_g1_i1.p1  ORF type:complete len:208 (-),score=29.40 TRINITY_DN19875_c0_g1_i1:208-831(-)